MKKNRHEDSDRCHLTPEQADMLIENQRLLMYQMARIQKYLFAGRVAVATIVCLGLTLDWIRDHIQFLRMWFFGR